MYHEHLQLQAMLGPTREIIDRVALAKQEDNVEVLGMSVCPSVSLGQ